MTNQSATEAAGPALDALGDPMRRTIVAALRDGPLAVGVLAERLPISRPATSQHLKVLQDAGLVAVRTEGTRRLYAVDPDGLLPLRDWIEGFWADALRAFATFVATTDTDPTGGT